MLAGRLRKPLIAQVAMLGFIFLVAAWLRVESHNWDEEQHINVDDLAVTKVALKRVNLPPDTSLSTLFDPQESPINPRADGAYFVYGAFPLYLVKTVSSAIAGITRDSYFAGLSGLQQTGRVLAGLFDAITALLVFGIGARLWGGWPGLVASAFYALAVLPIQEGHFFISDPFMVTFTTATLLCSVLFFQTRRVLFILLAGLCVGLAMACKFSAAPVVVLPLSVVLMRALVKGEGDGQKVAWGRAFAWTGMALGGAFLGLFVGDPFALLDAPTYLAQLGEEARIQSGAIDVWFTRKYVGTWPVVHLGVQMVLLGAGPLVGLAGMAGIGVVATRVWAQRRLVEALLLVGMGVYFAVISLLETRWVRYFLPLVPYLCLFATAFGFWIYERAAQRGMRPIWRGAALAMLLVSALLGAVAVNSIFRSEHTQLKASRWVFNNVPPGSRIGIEKTALEMPLPLPEYEERRKEYSLVSMDPMADLPSQEVADTLHAQLRDVDYLILDATQAAGTVRHLSWRYPVQIRYYDLLLSGQLGFSVALYSTSYPRIGNLQIPDDGGWVDPSFMDSSHPPIWVLKKERDLSDGEWAALFAEAVKQPSVASRRRP
ncbi:MAG TPA: glycosyltransferase family 39 protein [Chloroflexia bacterium]|nr:glycosyltransferase family 39 protein [Chloroflexia bacterium]